MERIEHLLAGQGLRSSETSSDEKDTFAHRVVLHPEVTLNYQLNHYEHLKMPIVTVELVFGEAGTSRPAVYWQILFEEDREQTYWMRYDDMPPLHVDIEALRKNLFETHLKDVDIDFHDDHGNYYCSIPGGEVPWDILATMIAFAKRTSAQQPRRTESLESEVA